MVENRPISFLKNGGEDMKSLVETLGLSGNPFENYTAETEPNIADYAVRPPYLNAIADRIGRLTSFILFGDRGAGKSATRITVYKEVWKENGARGSNGTFAVNLTDFTSMQDSFVGGHLSDKDMVRLSAFFVVEQLLIWLSSLEEEDRTVYLEGLNKEERTLVLALVQGFYLSVPEMNREISNSDALKLLNSAWTTRSAIWAGQRWEALSKIVAAIVNALARKEVDDSVDISASAEVLLKSLTGDAPNAPRSILNKLVEFVKAFGFNGVSMLIDKVDETPSTSNSAEATARLVHPLLSHVQLLEVDGFSWILFLWSNVKTHFEAKYAIRLDKIAHTNITWSNDSLREMIDTRVMFYSSGRTRFFDMFSKDLDANSVWEKLLYLSSRSPRELIKLMDTIFREHDARGDNAPDLLDQVSLDLGMDKFAIETVGSWFDRKPLQDVLRLGRTRFVNKDVQGAFKIGDQGARVKIKNWEDAGLVVQSGTVPSELGGKPVYQFGIANAKVERIIERGLDNSVGAAFRQDEPEESA